MRNAAAVLLLLFVLPAVAGAEDFSAYNGHTRYDTHFRKYSKRFFGPGFDWRYFKAQAVAESRLDEKAESAVGARGLMQIMPETFVEIRERAPHVRGTIMEPRWNIAAGIWYDRQLWKLWQAPRPFDDRLAFTFGSFNAGKGNVLRAQRIAKKEGVNPNLWRSMETVLPRVTGRRSRETLNYVDKIFEIREVLKW